MLDNIHPPSHSHSQFGVVLDFLQNYELREIEHLLQAGFSAQELDANTGNNFLHICAWENLPQAAQLFLGYGCSASQLNKNGLAPLHLATIKGNLEVVQVLLKSASQDIDIRTAEPCLTPLMLAAWHNQQDCLGAILASRARQGVLSRDKLRAIDYALWQNNQAAIDLLDVSMKSKYVSTINRSSVQNSKPRFEITENSSGLPKVIHNPEQNAKNPELDIDFPKAHEQDTMTLGHTGRIIPVTSNFDAHEEDFQHTEQQPALSNLAMGKELPKNMQPHLDTDLPQKTKMSEKMSMHQNQYKNQQDIEMPHFPDVNLQDIPDTAGQQTAGDSQVEFVEVEKQKSQELVRHFDQFELETTGDAEISLEEIIPDLESQHYQTESQGQKTTLPEKHSEQPATSNPKANKQKNLVAALAAQKSDERSIEDKLSSLRMFQKPNDLSQQDELQPEEIPQNNPLLNTQESSFSESETGIFAQPSDTQKYYKIPSLPKKKQDKKQDFGRPSRPPEHEQMHSAAPAPNLASLDQGDETNTTQEQENQTQQDAIQASQMRTQETPKVNQEELAFSTTEPHPSNRRFTPVTAHQSLQASESLSAQSPDSQPSQVAGQHPSDLSSEEFGAIQLPDPKIMQSRGIANIITPGDEDLQQHTTARQLEASHQQQEPIHKEESRMKPETKIYRSAQEDQVDYDGFESNRLLSGQEIIDEINSLADNTPHFSPPNNNFPFRTLRNNYVQSSLEMTIVNTLSLVGIDFKYKRSLFGTVTPGTKKPSFTFLDRNGNIIIWDMLDYDPEDATNQERWNLDRLWFENNGFKLNYNYFVMYDDLDNSYIDSLEIYKVSQAILDQC